MPIDKKELETIANAILEKRGQYISSLDLREIEGAICDYFVICNADSTTQVGAIAENIEVKMKQQHERWPIRSQGKENSIWIIIDYGNILVHIFQTEYRQFYRLDELWADAPKTTYKE